MPRLVRLLQTEMVVKHYLVKDFVRTDPDYFDEPLEERFKNFKFFFSWLIDRKYRVFVEPADECSIWLSENKRTP